MKILFLTVLSFAVVGITANDRCPNEETYECPVCDGSKTVQVKDCLSCDGYLQTDMKHNRCIDRRLFNLDDDTYRYLWHDIFGGVIWLVMSGIAIACGLGGGAIYVPLGMILLQFAPKPASGVSQASIFGATLAGLILNASSRHPHQKIRHDAGRSPRSGTDADAEPLVFQVEFVNEEEEKAYLEAGGTFYTRPIINFDMTLFMAPMLTAGAVLGVLVQKILPDWLYLLSCSLFLAFITDRTYRKYFEVTKADKKQKSAENNEGTFIDEPLPKGSDIVDEEQETNLVHNTASGEDHDLAKRKAYLSLDMRQFPAEKIAFLVVVWMGILITTLIKGGRGVSLFLTVQCDSPWYPVLVVSEFLWLSLFAIYFGMKLVRDQADRIAVQYPFLPHDPVWNYQSLRFYCVAILSAGFVAGLSGLGGMVLGPVMMIKGIQPQVSSATNPIMVVITGSWWQSLCDNRSDAMGYALFFLTCFAGALVRVRLMLTLNVLDRPTFQFLLWSASLHLQLWAVYQL